MASSMEFLNSLESLSEMGKFAQAVHEKIADGKLPPGQSTDELASLLGLHLPSDLRGTTISSAEDHEEPDPKSLTIVIKYPEEPKETHSTYKKAGCYTYCKTGPFGLGKVCITVCADCTFKRTTVSCTLTATISVSV